eukprot:NODE_1918_length_1356_cov_74.961744_g1737_i0.p1 GENE.NODE_1918_length_1356_cov_74.961744_g1737_i0~~NODE_1918_length_1356_cov_74.961744_g1737_i0.p1  ORF type:complete len:399 (+),score=103.58 NODE_1918_length_1356_cov_74.961744_g1737_i0:152-1198(+)
MPDERKKAPSQGSSSFKGAPDAKRFKTKGNESRRFTLNVNTPEPPKQDAEHFVAHQRMQMLKGLRVYKPSKNSKKNPKPKETAPKKEKKDPLQVATGANDLKQKYMGKLEEGTFRMMNQLMCESESKDSHQFFQKNKEAFEQYHNGYRQQAHKWPLYPLHKIIEDLRKYPSGVLTSKVRRQLEENPDTEMKGIPKTWKIADLGCGDAELAERMTTHKVFSFDLVALNPRVTVADIAHVPLKDKSVDVVVLCLALLGTNYSDYLREAFRILRKGGTLKFADIANRVNAQPFLQLMRYHGFIKVNVDLESSDLFVFIDFKRTHSPHQDLDRMLSTMRLDEIVQPFQYKKR